MKIAVFLPNWIGDAVMATPALRAIRTEFSQATVVGIVRPYMADVLAGLDLLDRVMLYDPRGKEKQQRGLRFVHRMRKEEFDTAVLLPNSLRAAWMARLSGAKHRFGLDRDGRGWLLTDRIAPKPKSEPHPVIDEYLRIAERLGCRALSREMELATSENDESAIEAFWNEHSVAQLPSGYLCLNPGGAFGAAKHWPVESFAALARRIVDKLNHSVLVLCGPQEREEAREIAKRADSPHVVSMADIQPTIGLTKAAIRHCELLVTTDSGPRHFAPPFQIPVVTLFGPTHIAWSETYYPRAVHLQHEVDCGPCQKRVCPLQHHRCMRDLSVDRVFNAVRSLLARVGKADAA